MQTLNLVRLFGLFIWFGLLSGEETRPNILIFMVDDLGMGDLPCYGNKSVKTPNIDQLCAEGAKLTHHTSPAVFCTPSRAAFLTGRYAVRCGLTSVPRSPPVIVYSSGTAGLPRNETSFATLLKSQGYKTGLIGKWHLGLNQKIWGDMAFSPLGHGFDYFFGLPFTRVGAFGTQDGFFTARQVSLREIFVSLMFLILSFRFLNLKSSIFSFLCFVFIGWFFLEHFRLANQDAFWQRSDFMDKFLNSFLMENSVVVEKPLDLTRLDERLTDKSVRFIQESAESEYPFLLMHSFTHVHVPLIGSPKFSGRSAHGPYGDSILETDFCIGRILETLRETGIDNNTFIFFTSDHGGNHPQVGDKGGFNGDFRGGKGNGALEGGFRVPGIVRWPGIIKAGSVLNQPTSHLDLLPTLAELSGADVSQMHLDGVSLVPLLTSNHLLPPRTLYHFCGSDVFSIRSWTGQKTYKWIFSQPKLNQNGGCDTDFCPCHGPGVVQHKTALLVDIDDDRREENPLNPESKVYTSLEPKMREELNAFRKDVARNSMPSQLYSWSVMPHPWLQPFLPVQYIED